MLDFPTVQSWLESHRGRLVGTAEPIAWADSREWRLEEGRMVHRSGGFFSLSGIAVSAKGAYFDGVQMPIIDQPEIGLLGFVVRPREDGTDWLVQAKSEPGSTHWVQVGPSVQATRSNYMRKHQGQATRFLDLFLEGRGEPVGQDHSEQGSRFLNKYNRNAVVSVTELFDTEAPEWKWTSDDEMRRALGQDFAVNTDARSVIVTHDWTLLQKDGPLFAGASLYDPAFDGLRAHLARSCEPQADDPEAVSRAIERLASRASVRPRVRTVPLDALPGWSMSPDCLSAPEGTPYGDIEFRMYRVNAPGREVESWDQPFSVGKVRHRAGLVLALRDGALHVALRLADEPGFLGKVQFGPTFQTDAPSHPAIAEMIFETGRRPALSVAQSDEGGRFMSSVVDYEIHDLTDEAVPDLGADFEWLTMSQLRLLATVPGQMTNEARSAISVLLSLA